MSVDLIAESNIVSTVGLPHDGNNVDWMSGNSALRRYYKLVYAYSTYFYIDLG